MVVLLAEDHDELAFDVFGPLKRIVLFPCTKRVRVDVCGEVTHRGTDALVESTAVRKMATEAHACGAHSPVAIWQRQ